MQSKNTALESNVAWSRRINLAITGGNLCKVQRLSCVSITGAMRTCPTAAIEVVLNPTTIHILAESITKTITCRMIGEGLVHHVPQSPQGPGENLEHAPR